MKWAARLHRRKLRRLRERYANGSYEWWCARIWRKQDGQHRRSMRRREAALQTVKDRYGLA